MRATSNKGATLAMQAKNPVTTDFTGKVIHIKNAVLGANRTIAPPPQYTFPEPDEKTLK